jgi:hypothetical protein
MRPAPIRRATTTMPATATAAESAEKTFMAVAGDHQGVAVIQTQPRSM